MKSKIREIKQRSTAKNRALAPRSARLPQFIGAPSDADSRLDSLKVAIIGCGSIGSNIALHLARLQAARLLLVDRGRLKTESILTHPAHPETISLPKASSLGRLCKRISPSTEVNVFDGPVETLDMTAFDPYDRIVLATDNLLAELEVSQRCLQLGLPLIQVSVHGDSMVSHIRSLSNHDSDGPCLVCAFSPAEWSALNNETMFSCEGASGGQVPVRTDGPPTMSVSFLCSMAADLALTHILRQELSLGCRDSDALLEFCGYTYRSVISPLVRNPDCVCDHSPYRRAMSRDPISHTSLLQLARMAGYGKRKDLDNISFRVNRMLFCDLGACYCKGGYPRRRFYPIEDLTFRCRQCGEIVKPQLFFTHDPVPAAMLAEEIDKPLRELGAGSARYVVVRGPRESVLISTIGMKG